MLSLMKGWTRSSAVAFGTTFGACQESKAHQVQRVSLDRRESQGLLAPKGRKGSRVRLVRWDFEARRVLLACQE